MVFALMMATLMLGQADTILEQDFVDLSWN